MKISPVSFKGSNGVQELKKGREEFEKLSDVERIGLIASEKFRVKANEDYMLNVKPKDTPLGKYVTYRVSIENILKRVLKNFKSPL